MIIMNTTLNQRYAILSVRNLLNTLRDELEIARKNAQACFKLAKRHENYPDSRKGDNFFLKSWSAYMMDCMVLKNKIKGFMGHLIKLEGF